MKMTMKTLPLPKLPKSDYPMTMKILLLCIALRIACDLLPYLDLVLSLTPYTPWGWITYQFAHANWEHLVFNFMFGLPFMVYVEHKLGQKALLHAYLVCGLGSAALHAMMAGITALIGSSGSISGLAMLAVLSFGKRPADRLLGLLLGASMLIIQLMMAVNDVGSNIAYWGHIGGMLTALGILWMRRQSSLQLR